MAFHVLSIADADREGLNQILPTKGKRHRVVFFLNLFNEKDLWGRRPKLVALHQTLNPCFAFKKNAVPK